MEIPVGPFLRRIHIARIHVCEGGFSYPLLPLFQQRSAIMISAGFFFFFSFVLAPLLQGSVLCSDRGMTPPSVELWSQPGQIKHVHGRCVDRIESDQLQSKTKGKDDALYTATVGSVIRSPAFSLRKSIIK